MAQETVVTNGCYLPVRKEMEAIDDNFDELYTSKESVESDVSDLQSGQGITLTEYATNALALAGGLSVGDFYTTDAVVMVVVAAA